MGKRRNALIALACLAAAISVWAFLASTQEPKYQGRPLSHWVDQYFPTYGKPPAWADQRASADEAVRQIGTNAIPLLLKWFEYDPRPREARAYAFTRKPPKWLTSYSAVMRLLRNDGASRRAHCATLALLALGPIARPAIPELARLMNSTNSAYLTEQATMVLARMGSDAIPAFTAAATDPQNPNRGYIIASLPKLGTNASLAVPLLMRLTTDAEPNVQSLAKHILYRVAPEALTNAPAPNPNP